jgi:adenylyltransferase/sulfurtransferase
MDSIEARYLLNRTAVTKKIPLFHGAVSGFNGQATSIIPGKTACLRCIFPRAPEPKATPVIGTTCGIIGCIQATETIKYILGHGELLENRLLLWDGSKMRMEEIIVERDPGCIECGQI